MNNCECKECRDTFVTEALSRILNPLCAKCLIIEMERLDMVDIIEQRLVRWSVCSATRLIHRLKARLIHQSDRGNELYEFTIPNGQHKTVRFLKYQCQSTGRIYISFVLSEFENADEAMAWKFQISEDEYGALEVET